MGENMLTHTHAHTRARTHARFHTHLTADLMVLAALTLFCGYDDLPLKV